MAERAKRKGAADLERPVPQQVEALLGWLERTGTKRDRKGMARYAIPSDKAFGVPVGVLQKKAKELGRNHDLALALWTTDRYEARMLAAFMDDPACVTPAQMDRWCREFDSWAICDTVCLHLFDRTPHAWDKVVLWSRRRDEFVRRAAFALIAGLALHDRRSGDAPFMRSLSLIERAAGDERNFVKKGVNWALRAVGGRNPALHQAATAAAGRLAKSADASARWIGKDALRQLASPATKKRLARARE
jgi:3-methyladenine DNA glycosylase AlkD